MLEIKRLTKHIKNKSILHPIDLSVGRGVLGILGPNGAGKTTLLRILATIYHPSSGEILLNGLSWSKDLEECKKHIGYLPQTTSLIPTLTCLEYLEYICTLRGLRNKKEVRERIEQTLHEVNLVHRMNDKVGKLSGGMKRRLGIAQAIIHDPALLLVDEPTAGLDPEERLRFRSLIRDLSLHRIVLFSTHISEDIEMTSDHVCVLHHGKLKFFDSLQDMMELAKGKVWSVKVDKTQFSSFRRKEDSLIVASSKDQNNELTVRLISETSPAPEAVSVEPTLEEGYMVWLRRNSNL